MYEVGGGAGGGSPSNFGEILKNQPHLGKFLSLIGQKCLQTKGFVWGQPPRFFLLVRLWFACSLSDFIGTEMNFIWGEGEVGLDVSEARLS